MADIDVKETIADGSTDFNLKRFKIGNQKFEMPVKTIDLNNTARELVDSNFKGKDSIVFEKSKLLKDVSPIKKVLNSAENYEINSFFGKKNWASDRLSVVTMSLKFNPLNQVKKIDDISAFFDYYHSYSGPVLFVPNVWHKVSKETVISVDDYIKYVDSVYQILNSRNGKPIFVPVSLKFSLNDLDKIINHYLRKEFFYIWFDLESKPVDQAINGRLRRINDVLRRSNQYDKIVTYYTNIKREVLSNVKDFRDSPASDILASTMGANFIGVNRDPPKFNPNLVGKQPSRKEIWQHKARKFNPSTYYYEKQKDGVFKSRNENVTNNAKVLNDELKNQSGFFLEKNELIPYLKNKKMLVDNPEIFKSIRRSEETRRLQDFF